MNELISRILQPNPGCARRITLVSGPKAGEISCMTEEIQIWGDNREWKDLAYGSGNTAEEALDKMVMFI